MDKKKKEINSEDINEKITEKLEELNALIKDKVHEGIESGALISRPVQAASSFSKDFKNFVAKGSIMDMAAGFVVGSSFGRIVSSLVSDILMPIVGVITGGVDFKDLVWHIKDAGTEDNPLYLRLLEKGESTEGISPTIDIPAVDIRYGLFIENLLDFLIIALCVYLMVRFFRKLRTREDQIVDALEAKEDEIVKKIQEDLTSKLDDKK